MKPSKFPETPLKNRQRKKQTPFAVLSADDIESYRQDNTGFCLACGVHHQADPEAKGQNCQWCKSPKVFGVDALVSMGKIDVANF